MNRSVILEVSSVEDALLRASEQLGVPDYHLNASVLSEEKSFFGLFGKKLRVEVTVDKGYEPAEPSENGDDKSKQAPEPSESETETQGEKSGETPELLLRSKEFLIELLDKMGLDAVPEISGWYQMTIEGPDSGIIVGKYGEALRSMEYLLNLSLRDDRDVPRVKLDSNGYRERREASLERVAFSAARKAVERGIPVRLAPMASWERRIVHIALRGRDDVTTESVGETPNRKVVVMPKIDQSQERSSAPTRRRRGR